MESCKQLSNSREEKRLTKTHKAFQHQIAFTKQHFDELEGCGESGIWIKFPSIHMGLKLRKES